MQSRRSKRENGIALSRREKQDNAKGHVPAKRRGRQGSLLVRRETRRTRLLRRPRRLWRRRRRRRNRRRRRGCRRGRGCRPDRPVEKAWQRRVRAPLHLVRRGRHASVEFLSPVRLHARHLSRSSLVASLSLCGASLFRIPLPFHSFWRRLGSPVSLVHPFSTRRVSVPPGTHTIRELHRQAKRRDLSDLYSLLVPAPPSLHAVGPRHSRLSTIPILLELHHQALSSCSSAGK